MPLAGKSRDYIELEVHALSGGRRSCNPPSVRPPTPTSFAGASWTRRVQPKNWNASPTGVTWVTDRYHLDHKVIPACWTHHGAVVEELCALRTFWEACYQEDAAPSDPLAFHRDLTLALRSRRYFARLEAGIVRRGPLGG